MRILLVEDNPGDIRLLQEYLKEGSAGRFQITYADRLSRGLERLAEASFDAVLLDLSLPDSQGVATLVRMHEAARGAPIVVLTSIEDETLGVQLIQAGAQDYLVKGQVTGPLLARSLRYAVERTRAEEALRQAEERYRGIFDNAVEGIFQSTPSGRYLSVNPALARMYGYKSPEELMVSVTDIGHEVYVDPNCRAALKHLLEWRDVVRGFEYEVYRKDGSTIWISESVRVVRDEQGAVLYYEGTIEDITERKRAEEARRRLAAIVECSYDAVISVTQGIISSWNPAAERLLGYSAEEILGKPVGMLIPPHRLSEVEGNLKMVLRGERIHDFETEWVRKDGGLVNLSLTVFPVKDATGNIIGASAIVRDITEHKRVEEERHKLLNDRLLLLESTGEGIYGIDLQGQCTFINKAAARMLRYQPEEVLGKNVHELIHHHRPDGSPYSHEQCRIFEAFRCGHGCQVDDEVLWRSDGVAFPVEYSSFPIVERGTVTGAVVTFTDITERKRAEEQLQSTLDQLRTLTRRLEVVQEEERTRIAREVHDELGVALTCIKMDVSRLNSMMAHASTLSDRFQVDDKIRSMMEFIDNTIAAVQKIVTELRPPVLDDLGLVAAIEWQAQDFQRRTGITCACMASPEDFQVDPERATTVFRICQEALTNVVRHAQATEVMICLEERAGSLKLVVRDNGRGIPEEKVLDPQSLGLLGMRERAQLFGGEVSIKGCPGKGTTTTLHLPGARSAQGWEEVIPC